MRWSRESTTGCCPLSWRYSALCGVADSRAERKGADFPPVCPGVPAMPDPRPRPAPWNCLPAQNHLIELVARPDRRRLLSRCESVDLVLGQVVWEPATVTRHVYFPIN